MSSWKLNHSLTLIVERSASIKALIPVIKRDQPGATVTQAIDLLISIGERKRSEHYLDQIAQFPAENARSSSDLLRLAREIAKHAQRESELWEAVRRTSPAVLDKALRKNGYPLSFHTMLDYTRRGMPGHRMTVMELPARTEVNFLGETKGANNEEFMGFRVIRPDGAEATFTWNAKHVSTTILAESYSQLVF